MRADPVQKYVGEMLRRTLVGDVQQAAIRIPKIIVERVVHHHADKRAHHDRRIDVDQRTFALSLAEIGAEKFVNVTNKLVEKHLRQFVFLECRVKQ